MARGAYEFRDAIRLGQFPEYNRSDGGVSFDQMDSTHEFLDRFYICRIGIRVLIGQYLALRQPPVENYIGIICSQTSPYEIVKRAIDDASFMCTRKYGEAPEVIISGKLEQTFPYVPTHLRKFSASCFDLSLCETSCSPFTCFYIATIRLHYVGTPQEQHASDRGLAWN